MTVAQLFEAVDQIAKFAGIDQQPITLCAEHLAQVVAAKAMDVVANIAILRRFGVTPEQLIMAIEVLAEGDFVGSSKRQGHDSA